jgi:hypothetical protein
MIPNMSIDVIGSPPAYVRSSVLTVRDSPQPGVICRGIALPRAKPRLFHVLNKDLPKPCSSVKLEVSRLAPSAVLDHKQT